MTVTAWAAPSPRPVPDFAEGSGLAFAKPELIENADCPILQVLREPAEFQGAAMMLRILTGIWRHPRKGLSCARQISLRCIPSSPAHGKPWPFPDGMLLTSSDHKIFRLFCCSIIHCIST